MAASTSQANFCVPLIRSWIIHQPWQPYIITPGVWQKQASIDYTYRSCLVPSFLIVILTSHRDNRILVISLSPLSNKMGCYSGSTYVFLYKFPVGINFHLRTVMWTGSGMPCPFPFDWALYCGLDPMYIYIPGTKCVRN